MYLDIFCSKDFHYFHELLMIKHIVCDNDESDYDHEGGTDYVNYDTEGDDSDGNDYDYEGNDDDSNK